MDHCTGSNEATDFGSISPGATYLEVPSCHALSDEAHNLESYTKAKNDVTAPIPDETNKLCIDGQY